MDKPQPRTPEKPLSPHDKLLAENAAAHREWATNEHADYVDKTHADRKAWEEKDHAELLARLEAEREEKKRLAAEAKRQAALNDHPPIMLTKSLDDRYEKIARTVAEKHPEYSPEIINFVKNSYKAEASRLNAGMRQIYNERTPSGMSGDRAEKRQLRWKLENDTVDRLVDKSRAAYGEQGVLVMRAFNKENGDPTVIDSIVHQFYDKGIKPGGVVGGLIGGLIAYTFAGSIGGANSWLTLLGIAAAAVIGGWAGNHAVDTIGKYVTWGDKKKGPATTPAQQPAKGAGAEQEQQQPITPEVETKARQALNQPAAPAPQAPDGPTHVETGSTVTPTPAPAPAASAPGRDTHSPAH